MGKALPLIVGLLSNGTSKVVIEIGLDFRVRWWFTNKKIRRGFLGAKNSQENIECGNIY
jgi:hypothetical protein